MTIKGFPSSQKLPLGTGITNEFATVVPTDEYRNSLDVNRPLFRVTTIKTAAANTGNIDGVTWVYDTSTLAKKGDVVRFETGNAQYIETPIVKVETNRFLLGAYLASAPAAGDTFYILRSVSPRVDATGTASVTATSSPLQFNKDAVATTVSQNTVTPSNSIPLPVALFNTNGPLPLLADGNGLKVSNTNTDIFGVGVSVQQFNQIEVNFEIAPGPTLITNTFVSTGSATISNGHTLYATGSGVTSSAKGVTVAINVYKPLYQSYSAFTVAFTTPTSANSYQRIGLYDSSNGFFIGFNGLNFGITLRSTGVDTFVNRTAFNGDLLTGLASSKFTRDGVPEAINLNFTNLFRIRFAWLGSAPILFEVYSPDGIWVVFHTLKFPNSQLNPSIANPDLPMTIDVAKASGDATDLIISTGCWAAGANSNLSQITSTITDTTLAPLNRSVITGVTTGGGGGYVNVKVNPSGAVVANVSGTVAATQSGTWSVEVNNFPATQPVSGSVSVSNFPATQPVSGTVGVSNLFALDTTVATTNTEIGALTETAPGTDTASSGLNGRLQRVSQRLTSLIALLPTSIGQKNTAGSLSVTLPSGINLPPSFGRSPVDLLFNDYSVTSVTTAAYVELIASTSADTNRIEIFDSSGEAMILAVGAAGVEGDYLYIFPGGNGPVELLILGNSRISVKAKTATASAGFLAINLYS